MFRRKLCGLVYDKHFTSWTFSLHQKHRPSDVTLKFTRDTRLFNSRVYISDLVLRRLNDILEVTEHTGIQ